MKKIRFAIPILWIGMIAAAKSIPSNDKVWVIVRPVQCLGNPWEKEWLAHHPHQDAKYPRAKELDLMRKFFSKKQVRIHDVRRKPYEGQGVCQTCACARGDVFYFLIYAEDVPQMVNMGYTERIPAADVPLKSQ